MLRSDKYVATKPAPPPLTKLTAELTSRTQAAATILATEISKIQQLTRMVQVKHEHALQCSVKNLRNALALL